MMLEVVAKLVCCSSKNVACVDVNELSSVIYKEMFF
jgi:hypothetical protein